MNDQGRQMPDRRCPYCLGAVKLYGNSRGFRTRYDVGPVWGCMRCVAWAKVDPRSGEPMTRISDEHLRQARAMFWHHVHPIVRRKAAWGAMEYRAAMAEVLDWISDRLPGRPKPLLIGFLDADQIREAIDVADKHPDAVMKAAPAEQTRNDLP